MESYYFAPKILLKVGKNCDLVLILGDSTFFETLLDAYTVFHTGYWQEEFTERIYWKYGDRLCQALKRKLSTLFSNKGPSSEHPSIWEVLFSLGACRTYASRLDFCPSLKEQASCLLLQSRLRSLSPPSMAAFLRYRSALSSGAESTTRTPEASLLLASGVPPSFVFAAIRGGFSSLSLGTLYGMRVLRLAYPAAALPKYSRSPATLRFCRLAPGKNHQKSPRSLKVRQTPRWFYEYLVGCS